MVVSVTVPPVWVMVPVLVTEPLPLIVPPLQVDDPAMVTAALAVSVPPARFNPALNVEGRAMVSVPPVRLTVRLALTLRTVKVPLAVIVVPPVSAGMMTLSVAVGTAPVLQFPAVPQLLSPALPFQVTKALVPRSL